MLDGSMGGWVGFSPAYFSALPLARIMALIPLAFIAIISCNNSDASTPGNNGKNNNRNNNGYKSKGTWLADPPAWLLGGVAGLRILVRMAGSLGPGQVTVMISLPLLAGGFRVAQFVRIEREPSHCPFMAVMALSASCGAMQKNENKRISQL